MAEIEDLKIVGGSTYTVGNQDIIANEWEAGKTYVKGKSYVIREHRLYVCNVTHTSVEPFDATKWTEITIGDAIANNTTAIGALSSLATTHKDSLVNAVNDVNTKVNTKADASTALKREIGSGAGSGQTFTMETGGSTNACWLVFFGGTYVGVITIFNTSIAIAKVAGSINATVSLSGTTITISLSGAPWTQLRYVKLFV